MDQEIRDALVSFMYLTLRQLHPNLDEYPLKEVEDIDSCEGDEIPKIRTNV